MKISTNAYMKCCELLDLKKEREASTSAATAGAWYHFRSATYKNKTKNFSISYNSTDLSKLLFYFCICQHHQSIQTDHTVQLTSLCNCCWSISAYCLLSPMALGLCHCSLGSMHYRRKGFQPLRALLSI